jgi:hypothetical protein
MNSKKRTKITDWKTYTLLKARLSPRQIGAHFIIPIPMVTKALAKQALAYVDKNNEEPNKRQKAVIRKLILKDLQKRNGSTNTNEQDED